MATGALKQAGEQAAARQRGPRTLRQSLAAAFSLNASLKTLPTRIMT